MSSSGLKKEEKDEVVIKVGVHDSLTSIKRNNNIIIKVIGFVHLLYVLLDHGICPSYV